LVVAPVVVVELVVYSLTMPLSGVVRMVVHKVIKWLIGGLGRFGAQLRTRIFKDISKGRTYIAYMGTTYNLSS